MPERQEVLITGADLEHFAKVVAQSITETAVITALRAWEDKQKRADERIYGWKAICAEVSLIRGTPTEDQTIRNWERRARFPLDRTRTGTVSAVRWEIERWLVAAGWCAPPIPRSGRPPGKRRGQPGRPPTK